MNDWKDLEIDNIPGDSFANERYEIRYYQCLEWRIFTGDLERRAYIIDPIRQGIAHQYRLKPVKPIQITKKINDLLIEILGESNTLKTVNFLMDKDTDFTTFTELDDRPVEIMED